MPAEAPEPHGTPLQPALIQRELLTRRIQQLADGDASAPGADRRELALEALASLQPATTSPSSPEEALHQIGLNRRRIGSALGLLGGMPGGFAFDTVRGRGGEIRRQQWRIGSDSGPAFHLNLMNADAGFSRFQDLTAEEKSWTGAMRGMRRLEFGADRLALAGGRSQFGLLQLADGSSRARRTSLGFTGSRWTLQALSQRVDDGFKRLSDLTDADRKLFGAERGVARDSLDLGYAFNPNRKLNISSLALRAASGTAERRQMEFTNGPRLQLRLITGRVDPKFDRLADLLEPDRNALTPQRGTRWSDLTVAMHPSRWLTTENQWLQSTSLETGRKSKQLRNLWTLQFGSRSKLVLLRNLMATPSDRNGRSHSLTQSVRWDQWLTRTLFFTGLRETVQNAVSGGPNSPGRRLALHLNTAPAMKLQASADLLNTVSPDGKRERGLLWNLALPLRPGLALQAKGERHLLSDLTSSQAVSLGLTGKLARAWDMALTLNTASPGKGPASRDLGARMTFAGLPNTRLFHDTHLVLSLGDTAGLPSALPVPQNSPKSVTSPPAPTTGTAKATPPNPNCLPARRLRSIALETKLRGQPVALGFASAVGTAGGLTYRLATNPKRRLQLEALRELRDLGRTSLVAHQRYALRARLGRSTQLSFLSETHPELSPGKLLLGHALTKTEAQTRIGRLDLTGSLSWDRDNLLGIGTALTGCALAGNLDPLTSLKVSYSGRSGRADPAIPDHLVRLAFERKPDDLLRVALRTEWRGWGNRRADELAWQLDLAATF